MARTRERQKSGFQESITFLRRGMLLAAIAALLSAPIASAGTNLLNLVDLALSDPARHAELRARGAELGRECAQCHGINGNSTYSWVPNLAAQNPRYLASQIGEFVTGSRKDYVMTPLMRSMDESDHVALALHFAASELLPPMTSPPGGDHPGHAIYREKCLQCHGADALGDREHARLATQQKQYLMDSIRAYQDGERTADVPGLLEAVNSLSPAELDQVTDYLSRLR